MEKAIFPAELLLQLTQSKQTRVTEGQSRKQVKGKVGTKRVEDWAEPNAGSLEKINKIDKALAVADRLTQKERQDPSYHSENERGEAGAQARQEQQDRGIPSAAGRPKSHSLREMNRLPADTHTTKTDCEAAGSLTRTIISETPHQRR